jgi:hypothetical protein
MVTDNKACPLARTHGPNRVVPPLPAGLEGRRVPWPTDMARFYKFNATVVSDNLAQRLLQLGYNISVDPSEWQASALLDAGLTVDDIVAIRRLREYWLADIGGYVLWEKGLATGVRAPSWIARTSALFKEWDLSWST